MRAMLVVSLVAALVFWGAVLTKGAEPVKAAASEPASVTPAAPVPPAAGAPAEGQQMTAEQALQVLEQWRAVAILPQSSLRDHLLIQEALRVLTAFVGEHQAAAKADAAKD